MARPARTALVITNLRCNQNCTYCNSRSASDDLAFIAGKAVRARIDEALAAGSRDVILTGGEPTLRRDLEGLVAHAKAGGAERVALETNATLIDDGRARSLGAAGLDVARVNLVGLDATGVDAVTRDPGGLSRTLAGIEALIRAGVAIEILAVAVRSTQASLADLPEKLSARIGHSSIRAIEVAVPLEGPDDAELLDYEHAAVAVGGLERGARIAGIPLRVSPAAGMPPCVFAPETQARIAHLYSFTPEAPRRPGYTQLDSCSRCALADRCSGIADAYLARRPPPPMHPVTEERMRRRLSMAATVPEQIAQELVSQSLFTDDSGQPFYEEIVRINFHCNQSCTFCFVSTHLPSAERAVVENAIRSAGKKGARIVLSGGEPTLNPHLLDYVRLAKSVAQRGVCLQTNAVRLDDAKLVGALAAAGVDEAFVSLHGCTAEVSDAVTETPGTFARTLIGIDYLARSAIRVVLNFVICDVNRHELVPFVRFVAARWPNVLAVNVSFVAASTDIVPRDARLMPRYSAVLPALGQAAEEARRLGVRLCGFESMCGIPLCLVPPSLEMQLTEIPPGFDRGEFLKVPACQGCTYEKTCYGVRRGYAELHGTGELRTVRHEVLGGP